jgi:phosphoribosylanthranilate isomerase
MRGGDKRRDMAPLVKICGINTALAADAAVRARADFCGLVFHPKSPRHVGLETARALAERMRGRARLVMLLCDPDDETIAAVMAAVHPDFLQLHGRETAERVAAVHGRFDVPLIKAFPIAEAADFAPVAAYAPFTEMFLFDAKAPPGAVPGGQGAAFDWQLLKGRRFARPWFLAGGLKPDNVARAIAACAPDAVDVSSGVETAPGVKNPDLIAAFVSAARGGTPS